MGAVDARPVRIGSIELHPVADAVGLFDEYRELYPEVAAEIWEPYRALYPELFSGTSWRVSCKSFVVRAAGATILVDTGVGPPGLLEWTPEDEGRLPESLDGLGIDRNEVDIVFLTHLHIDHLGWNTDLEGTVFFPRARYVVNRDALEFARTRPELPHIRRCVEPLADRFETTYKDVALAPGVTAFVAPGHYPGHMAVRLSSEDEEALLIADTAVHPAMLDQPELTYLYDVDPPTCVATRRTILPEVVDRDVLVACGHYPGSGIGRLVSRGNRTVWEEASGRELAS